MKHKVYLVATFIDCRNCENENTDAYAEAFLNGEDAWSYLEEEIDYLKDEYDVEEQGNGIVDEELSNCEGEEKMAKLTMTKGLDSYIAITYRILWRDTEGGNIE